jgi:hypothetical protein
LEAASTQGDAAGRGEFSRGKESIRADGSIVLVGNFEVDVEHQQRIGHLFGPLPPEMRNDTAFMDRIHGFLPGWDVPKLNPGLFTEHFGLVSDFLSECFTQLRNQSRVPALQGRVFWGGALSGRDINGVNKTVSGLLKLLHPDADAPIGDDDLEWAVRLALEVRRRVKEQQKRIGAAERTAEKIGPRRADRGWRGHARRYHRTHPQRRHAGRDGGREGREVAVASRHLPPAVVRPVGRHGHEARRRVLPGRARRLAEGVGGLNGPRRTRIDAFAVCRARSAA